MDYLERLSDEVKRLRELNDVVPTLPLTAEQKKLLQGLIRDGILSKDFQLKKIEADMDAVKNNTSGREK